jgi:hypothetical protein
VINPRANDDTPVGRSGANRDRKFVMGGLFSIQNQWLGLKNQSALFDSLKDRSRRLIDNSQLLSTF